MRQILEPRHASTSTATNEKQLRVDNQAASSLILYTHTQPHCNISISILPCCYSNQESIPKHRSSLLFHLRARQIRETMATTFASAAVAIPSFTGLKAETPKVVFAKQCSSGSAGAVKAGAIKASLKDVSVAAAAAAASLVLASNAMAIDVKLGSDDGGLVFEPREFSVPAGEKITFKNNAGFPHNVVFDEDEVPDGVDAGAISMPEDALLNGPGETFDVTLLTKGVYSFYCAPHQGAGMVGKVVVN